MASRFGSPYSPRSRGRRPALPVEDGGVKEDLLGGLGRLLDIVSRPNYAVMEASRRYNDDENNKDVTGKRRSLMDSTSDTIWGVTSPVVAPVEDAALAIQKLFGGGDGKEFKTDDAYSGLWGGFSGKNKTTASTVMAKEGAKKNLARGATGFALDVVLDPLNAVTFGAKSGATQTTKQLASAGSERAAAKLAEKGEGELVMKILGREVARSKDAYKLGRSITRPLTHRSTGEGRLATRLFSPVEEAGGQELFDLQRRNYSVAAASADERSRGIRDIFSHLTKEERTKLFYSLEEGTDLSKEVPLKGVREIKVAGDPRPAKEITKLTRVRDLVAEPGAKTRGLVNDLDKGVAREVSDLPTGVMKEASVPGQVKLLEDTPVTKVIKLESLEDYKQVARGMLDDMFEQEVKLGIRNANEKLDNYVPKYFAKMTGNEAAKLKPRSARDLKSSGETIFDDLGDAMMLRSAKMARVQARQQFVDEAIKEMGIAKLPKGVNPGDWIHTSDLPGEFKRFDSYLPRKVGESLKKTVELLDHDKAASELMRKYDRALQHWKFWATVARPGHHMQNFVGDFITNASQGAVEPRLYDIAARTLVHRRNALTATALGEAPVGDAARVLVAGQHIPVDKVWELYNQGGAKSGFIIAELERGIGELDKATVGSKLKATVGDAADTREDFARLAHFIHVLDKEAAGKRLVKNGTITEEGLKAAQAAADKVRKWNLDYGAKTQFERNVMSRAMPFYTFMRKQIPLQVEMLFTKPGFVALYPKTQRSLEGMLGTDEEGDTMLPEWVRQLAPVRLATDEARAKSPIEGFLKMMGVDPTSELVLTGQYHPFTTLNKFDEIVSAAGQGRMPNAGEVLKPFVNDLGPPVKAPIELTTGKYLGSGAPVEGTGQWLTRQVPQVGAPLTNSRGFDKLWMLRFFTGAPVHEVTQGAQRSEQIRRGLKNKTLQEIVVPTKGNRYQPYGTTPRASQ